MIYPNQHKKLIAMYLTENPQLEKWQARILANRKIGNEILTRKDLKNEIKNEIKKSEFEAMTELKSLKVKIKNAQKA